MVALVVVDPINADRRGRLAPAFNNIINFAEASELFEGKGKSMVAAVCALLQLVPVVSVRIPGLHLSPTALRAVVQGFSHTRQRQDVPAIFCSALHKRNAGDGNYFQHHPHTHWNQRTGRGFVPLADSKLSYGFGYVKAISL